MGLPYNESLGILLKEMGYSDGFIIGDPTGRQDIEWISKRAQDLDLEITTHPSSSTRLIRKTKRPDGEWIHEHPSISTQDGTAYVLLSAKYIEKAIRVECNVVKDQECDVREIPVQELRSELSIASPKPILSGLFSRHS